MIFSLGTKHLGFTNAAVGFYTRIIVGVWSFRKKMQLEAVQRFHTIEADGVWHLFQLLFKVDSSKERAKIFQHLLEEDSHAELFSEVYQNDSNVPFKAKQFNRKMLVSGEVGVGVWLLHVHAGEVSATRQFRALIVALPDGALRSALEKIVNDEAGHIELTNDLATQMGVTPRVLQRELKMIQFQRLTHGIKQMFLGMTNTLGIWILTLGYWSLGGFAKRSARVALSRRFVVDDNNFLKKFPR